MRAGHSGEEQIGDRDVFTAIDRSSKLLLCWHLGKRDGDHTRTFVAKLHPCVAGRPQVSTDGFAADKEAVENAWNGQVDFAMIVKDFISPAKEDQRRYSPAAIIRVKKTVVCDNPDENAIGTSRMERFNLSIRMHNRRDTRLTNAHSQKWANHEAMLGLQFAWYNWCRKHMTIKTTPAVPAGLATAPWTLERLLTEAAKTVAV